MVADEPTSALDVSVRAQILNLLLDLKERLGLALVFVSHDIQTVRRMSDRVVTMYLGRIVEEAPADRVTDHARHPYTRALFSATPGLLDPLDAIPLAGPVPPDPSAERLPVPYPLLAGGLRVRHRDAGHLGRVGGRTPLPLPPSCGGGRADPRSGAPGGGALPGHHHGRATAGPETRSGALMPFPAPLTGVVPPVCTPLTPEREVGRVPSLVRLVDHLVHGGVDALFVLGSSSEAAFLTDRQRRLVVETVVSHVAAGSPCWPGRST